MAEELYVVYEFLNMIDYTKKITNKKKTNINTNNKNSNKNKTKSMCKNLSCYILVLTLKQYNSIEKGGCQKEIFNLQIIN